MHVFLFQFPRLHNSNAKGFDLFTGVQAGSSKEADFSITPSVTQYPSIVVESGWSESFPRLRIDKDLWIHGCGGHVQLGFLIKWNKLSGGRVSGVFEGWAGDAAANDQFIQTEVISLNYLALYSRKSSTDSLQTIYPSPSASIAAAQSIHVTRSQIFGGQVLPRVLSGLAST